MKNKAKKKINEIARLAALPDEQIDTSEIPELKDWNGAKVGKFYRPIKEPVTIRLDADVLGWLKSRGRGYQTRINYLLRRAMLLSGVRHRRRKSRR